MGLAVNTQGVSTIALGQWGVLGDRVRSNEVLLWIAIKSGNTKSSIV